MKRGIIFSLLMLFSSASIAAEGGTVTLQTSSFYLGGGLNSNSYLGARSFGFQVLGGYEFAGKLGKVKNAVELGYLSTGTFETKDIDSGRTSSINRKAQGVWINYVASYPIGSNVEGLWRVGIDFGDDDGIMGGAGMGYNFNRNWSLRSEYVVREAVNSFQFNLLYGF